MSFYTEDKVPRVFCSIPQSLTIHPMELVQEDPTAAIAQRGIYATIE